jgi:hypothetical protein
MLTTQECIFCGDRPTNKEDIWPKWIGRYLGHRPTNSYLRAASGLERTFKGMSYSARAKVVCKDRCNGGWMKGLEDENSPLMKRMFDEKFSVRILAGPTQLSLARWILKTAMMIQYIEGPSVIPSAIYREFLASDLTIPDHCWIYLARHTMEQMPNGSHSIAWDVGATPHPRPGVPYHGELYGVTFFIQNLVMQVVGYRLDSPSRLGLDLRFPQRFRPYIQEIWPMGWGFNWPPDKPSFNDAGLRDFAAGLAEMRGSAD